MLIGRMVDDQFSDDPQLAAVRLPNEMLEVGARPVGRVNIAVVRDIIAVISQWRWIEWQQPDGIDAKLLDVVELVRQAAEVADPVVVGIEERLDVELIDDGVLVPLDARRLSGNGRDVGPCRGWFGHLPGSPRK